MCESNKNKNNAFEGTPDASRGNVPDQESEFNGDKIDAPSSPSAEETVQKHLDPPNFWENKANSPTPVEPYRFTGITDPLKQKTDRLKSVDLGEMVFFAAREGLLENEPRPFSSYDCAFLADEFPVPWLCIDALADIRPDLFGPESPIGKHWVDTEQLGEPLNVSIDFIEWSRAIGRLETRLKYYLNQEILKLRSYSRYFKDKYGTEYTVEDFLFY